MEKYINEPEILHIILKTAALKESAFSVLAEADFIVISLLYFHPNLSMTSFQVAIVGYPNTHWSYKDPSEPNQDQSQVTPIMQVKFTEAHIQIGIYLSII